MPFGGAERRRSGTSEWSGAAEEVGWQERPSNGQRGRSSPACPSQTGLSCATTTASTALLISSEPRLSAPKRDLGKAQAPERMRTDHAAASRMPHRALRSFHTPTTEMDMVHKPNLELLVHVVLG